MPIFKVALAVLIGFLPLNFLRVLGYRLLFGYRIENPESDLARSSLLMISRLRNPGSASSISSLVR
ncbi:MAG: hypothetical protein U0X93_11560 [Anaerolineales bacterium]